MNQEINSLFVKPTGIQTRWASPENPKGEKGKACINDDGRKRSPCKPIKAGDCYTLAEVNGSSGTIRRIWITIDHRIPKMMRGLRIDIYWDGQATPAVSAPLGDFFCHGVGRMSTFQNALFSSPEGRSYVCYIPMPFKTGMRVTVTNETDSDLNAIYHDVNYTLGDIHGPETLYFHTHWRRENPTTLRKDFEILPRITGSGRFLGANISVIGDIKTYSKSWWGEGEVKVFLDGDTDHPTIAGTGTEDYIGTGWGQGQYTHLYQGCQLADHEKYHYGFYRLHIPDPVYFESEIRVTIQQIGCWDPGTSAALKGNDLTLYQGDIPVNMEKMVKDRGYGLYERQDDWATCTYFYLNAASNNLPALAHWQKRVEDL